MCRKTLGAQALIAGLCVLLISTSAFAATPRTERGALAHKIVLKWAPYVQEAYKGDIGEWSRAMTPLMLKADTDALRKAADARTFDAMNEALLGDVAPKTAAAAAPPTNAALGSAIDDLVLVPVAPCRIIDTRLAGGAIPAGTSRDFDVTAVANYTFQGGAANDCGVGSAGSFAAAIINFVVVSPSAGGYITAYPYNTTRPLASTLNYITGDVKANLAVVKLDQGAATDELSIYTFSTTHVVADIVGYFINPAPTALECTNTALTEVAVAIGGVVNATAPGCPAGYTQTTTNCEASSFDMPLVYHNSGTCSAKNNSGSAQELRAGRTCCRVPGR